MNHFSPSQNLTHLRLVAALASLCLSFLTNKFDYLMNVDGILYLRMADAFIDGGLAAASELYDWPFFSILIGLISQHSWLDLQTSALILNTMLFIILTDSLILISNEGLRSTSQTAIAAILILCFYTLNEYRDFIIRDVGYWAMTCLALFHFLKFLRNGYKSHVVMWLVFSAISVMFRIEGLVIIALLPLAVLFSEMPKKLHAVSLCYLPILAITSVLVILMLLSSDSWNAFAKISDYDSYIHTDKLMMSFEHHRKIIANEIVPAVAEDQAGILLISGLVGVVLHPVFTGISVSLLILLGISFRTKVEMNKSYLVAIGGFVLINFLILFSFSLSKHFMSTRYAMLTILGIVLLMLPKLTSYVESCIREREKVKIFLVVFLLAGSLIDTFHKTHSKKYIKDAINWTGQNTKKEAYIYTNDKHVAFHLEYDHQRENIVLNQRKLPSCDFDYAVIVERHLPARISRTIEKCGWKIYKNFTHNSRSVKVYASKKNSK